MNKLNHWAMIREKIESFSLINVVFCFDELNYVTPFWLFIILSNLNETFYMPVEIIVDFQW